MRLSLILCTIGRREELARFLDCLAPQLLPGDEVLLVDQNPPGFLDDLLAARALPGLVRLTSAKGLSRARNVGLLAAGGDVILFPDDDCWYPADHLGRLRQQFDQHSQWDGMTWGVRGDGPDGPWWPSLASQPGMLDQDNHWSRSISFAIALRRPVVEAVGPFDVALGVGSGTPWGSGEESDYLIRALAGGARLAFVPDLVVFHPSSPPASAALARKFAAYGAGLGRVLRLHALPMRHRLSVLVRPLAGACWCGLRGRFGQARLYLASFSGRLQGLCAPVAAQVAARAAADAAWRTRAC